MASTVRIEEGLRAYFLLQAGVTDIVESRIRADRAFHSDKRPFLVIEPPEINPEYHAGGGVGIAETFVNLHCEADDYTTARNLSEVIRKLFADGFQGDMEGVKIRALFATVRGNRSRVVSGDEEGFRSATVRLQIFHELVV